ncbi:MAG: hypothetical protein DRJ42_10540 [Deltaproteobacteria bacterium]|nr:MAG: hypothetical protein DRJ42_10540 [Deltaproteobacteria bacterium]
MISAGEGLMRVNPWLVVVFVAAIAGGVFSSFSTYDFVAHLDRQVHGIHCSFLPGIEQTDASGATGCHVTLMSPYSSVLRTSIWGGIPVSLPGMSVFAFLAFAALFLGLRRRDRDVTAAWFLVAATTLPVLTSIGMGYLALVTLGAACKMCIGIYAASGVALVGALGFVYSARRSDSEARDEQDAEGVAHASTAALGIAFAIGVAFVVAPVAAYAATAPDFDHYVGACGELTKLEVADGVLIPLGPQSGGTEVLEVLDPLCSACRGFERRFEAADFAPQVSRKALLFPLDDECNWMIGDAIHPGACAVSEAILCADDRAEEVLHWAFEEQDAIRTAAENDPEAAGRMATDRFPFIADCIGTPQVRARLNLALRFAVDNQMPIITPQVYVGGTRLCDEDTDLGMDYALARLLSRTGGGAPRVQTVEADDLVAREVERERAPRPSIRRAPAAAAATTETPGAEVSAQEDIGEDPAPSAAEETDEAAEGVEGPTAVEAPSEPVEEGGDAPAAEEPPPAAPPPSAVPPAEAAAPTPAATAEEAP